MAKLLEQDGQADLPKIETPHLAMLAHWSAGLIQAEWIRCEDDCHLLGMQLAVAENAAHGLRLRCEITAQYLATARQRAAAGPAPLELCGRLPAEADTTTHPDELIARRRRTALANAVRRAQDAHVETCTRLDEEMRRSALLRELLIRRERVASARALRVHQHFQLRRAVYLGRLVRRHANRALLNLLLELSTPDLPPWVRDEPAGDAEAAR
ncbi:hypothetical protein [Nonomuraea jabiensis]|uniref:hypothetical protein n=1 Tax=Nonomuraea jabiensis TaxID=882448 RepID=UPI003D756D5C